MNDNAGPYVGLDRFACRQAILSDLEKDGLLVKVEPYSHAVGHCQRCRTIIEPIASKQWFIKMLPLAKPAIDAVASGRISIIPEARIAAASPATTAMHDVTEGGIATALEELGIAGEHRLRLYRDSIPIYQETSVVCELMDIDPLGLIGSGSLLITCRQKNCQDLMRTLQQEGIQVTLIGEVLDRGRGIEAIVDNQPVEWPKFEVDEIARLF